MFRWAVFRERGGLTTEKMSGQETRDGDLTKENRETEGEVLHQRTQSGKAATERGGETAEYSKKRGIIHGNTVYFFSEYSAYFAVATVPGCSRPTSSNEEPMQFWSKMLLKKNLSG
jgi:hypothetical protein